MFLYPIPRREVLAPASAYRTPMNPKFVRYLTDRHPTVIRSPREALMTARINTPGSPNLLGGFILDQVSERLYRPLSFSINEGSSSKPRFVRKSPEKAKREIGLLGALPTSRHLRPIKTFSIEEAMTFSISENPRHAFFILYSLTFLIVWFWLHPRINLCIHSTFTYTEYFDWLLRPREYKPLITTSNIEMIRSCKYATPRGFVLSTRWRDTCSWRGSSPKSIWNILSKEWSRRRSASIRSIISH